MSDFVTTAIANLVINGEPAKRKIQELEGKIQHLNQQKVQK